MNYGTEGLGFQQRVRFYQTRASKNKTHKDVLPWLVENWMMIPYIGPEDFPKEMKVKKWDLYRLAVSLGYDGWPEMRNEVAKEVQKTLDRYLDMKQRKDEVAQMLYRRAKQAERISQAPTCPHCHDPRVFRVKHEWFYDTANGQPEPRIYYCPSCGKQLGKARGKQAGN